jgi:hypothetical protein
MTLRPYVDLPKSDYIAIDLEWRVLGSDEPEPEDLIEGRCESYGCDTGCTGYVLYEVRGGQEKRIGDWGSFYFERDKAVKMAEEAARSRGLPIILRRDWDN